jgi:predicted murein hydrolase (TIGR00659 family)
MSDTLFRAWVYLSATPLVGLTATLLAYQIGYAAFLRANRNPLANPVLIAIALLAALLAVSGTSYQRYFEGAQFVHFLLGPATVALAVPLYRNFRTIRRTAFAIGAAIVVGSLVAIAIVTAIGTAWLLGASRQTLLSLAPKSVTTPVAMGISEQIGGLPSLTAALVIPTGIVGATFATLLLDAVGIKDWRARSLSVGLAAHGIGTARAFQANEIAGAFADVGMGLSALATALLVPAVVKLLP